MRRIPLSNLSPGMVLSKPLHNKSKKLLLAPGKKLTLPMFNTLRNSDEEFVFLGKWNEQDAQRYGQGNRVKNLRNEADKLIVSLRQEYDERLKDMDLSPAPSGPALMREMNLAIPEERSSEHINDFMILKDEGEQFVEDMVNGWVHDDEVGQSVYALTEKFSNAMCKDPNLLSVLSQAKNSDTYLFGHSVNVSLLSMRMGATLGHDKMQIMDIGAAAMMQDLGMAMVPDEVLNKPDRLDKIEMLDVQKHTYRSVYMIERFQGIPLLSRFLALQCHERINGSGYPRKRPGTLIHRFAKIVSVADVYESLISDRPWRAGLSPYRAMEQLIQWTSKGDYESDAIRSLLYTLSLYPIGTYVELSNGEKGRVISANGVAYDRPVIAVTIDASGARLNEPHILNLKDQPEIKVAKVLEDWAKEMDTMTAFAA